jgi:3-hydroxy-9,10-secoandrosta-1,3,5(10)-triene-9,17-dione monooxygenase reductase component
MLKQIATSRSQPTVDERSFRAALGAFPTGVTIVTTGGRDCVYGMTATAVTSVSLRPPLVLVCAGRHGHGAREIQRHEHFVVNVLGAEQEHLSRYFASPARRRGHDAMHDVPHRLTAGGAPVLAGVAAHLECTLTASHVAGDHVIFVGEVEALSVDPEIAPLLVHGSRYRRLAEAA